MQLFQTISRKSLSIWLSLLCMLSLWSSFSLSASAEDTIPFPIAWQQSEGSGAEEQRLAGEAYDDMEASRNNYNYRSQEIVDGYNNSLLNRLNTAARKFIK